MRAVTDVTLVERRAPGIVEFRGRGWQVHAERPPQTRAAGAWRGMDYIYMRAGTRRDLSRAPGIVEFRGRGRQVQADFPPQVRAAEAWRRMDHIYMRAGTT